MITITFPDGKTKEYAKGITGREVVESIGKRLAEAAVAMLVDNTPRDLSFPLDHNALVRFLTFDDPQGKEIFRHSSSHLLAHAIKRLYPYAKPTIGPPVEEGFYYDFDDLKVSEDDLPRIEEEMRKIVSENYSVERIEYRTQGDAVAAFKDNLYKVEMIQGHEEGSSAYKEGDFLDLCRGPHVPRTGMLKAVKLMKLAGAYWRGDAKNKQLTRIYGITFPEEKQLKDYLSLLEEAEKRDHKRIGKEMEIYMLHELVGKGLPIWLPNGEIIRREIEKFAVECEEKDGYVRVATPHMAKQELFLQSGHLPHYKESMYPPMVMDDGTYYLKAMNCPIHHLVFNHRSRSYRELPLRIAEYGTCYRNELSGSLSGLLRVRMLSMNDAHIYCTKDQIADEFKRVLNLTLNYYTTFGFKDFSFRLSLGDPENKGKYIDEPENWAFAEAELRRIVKELKLPCVEGAGEAAFYGPKIDIQFKTIIGREESMSTIQLDFAAKSRFSLHYADNQGKESSDVFVIHRAPLSTHERFIAFLIEHCAGKFPLWLAPVQVVLMTITDNQREYAHALEAELKEHHIRVEIDDRSESMPKKVRDSQGAKIPLMITLGDKEVTNHTVAIRTLDGKVKFGVRKDEFVKSALQCIAERSLQLPW
jgi:threonyl-tRNA synthetase